MKILSVLPDCDYYVWQMLVQLNNLRKVGYEEDTIFVIGIRNIQVSEILNNIMKWSKSKCSYYLYRDDRNDLTYSSAMRPNILKKFFKENPQYKNETFLYIDPDVIFKEKINFSNIENNNTWYLSDTRSYIGSKYIKSKSLDLFYEMCRIVGVNPRIVEENEDNAGGAQYLIKNTDFNFWNKIEKDSIELYKHMKNTENKYSPKSPIQSWTADMWAVLWNSWLFGHETKIIKRLNFAWATDPIKKWDLVNIYHNAGAVTGDEFFIKTKYQKSPFKQKIKCSDKYCSYKYLLEVNETEENFKNVIF